MIKFSIIKQNQNINLTNKVIDLIDENISQIQENQFLHDVDWNLVKEMNNVNLYKEHIYALKMTIDNHISQNQ
jgi:hypothetical protein